MTYIIVKVLFTACLLQHALSYSTFRDSIPNGYNVSNPCNPADEWLGVGHQAPGGGGDRNPFGVAFMKNSFTWTEALCMADSDNDNRTNGEELGDPKCIWKKGDKPEISEGLSHPGICEPYDSESCRKTNDFLDCASTVFKCDVIDDDKDIIQFDARLDESEVPAQETTYMCQVLDVPDDKEYHMVATKPYIDNINVMHHVLVYGCDDDAVIEESSRSPSNCFMNSIRGCNELIALWSFGILGVCYHENAGFRMGMNGYKRVVVELHWNNPMKVSTYTDGSGLTLYLTPNLRDNDAGMFYIGQTALAIPPGIERHRENSTCSSECTRRKMEGNINIVGVLNHMHYLGSGAVSQMVTDEGKVHHLSYEEDYSYDRPKFELFDEPVVMEPGYKLQLTCHFDSSSSTTYTHYGEGTNDEMCYAFLMYYPKSNWKSRRCVSTGLYDDCGVAAYLSDGCDYAALGNDEHPITKARSERLYTYCAVGYCKDGCRDVVRDIFQEPCFKGEPLKIIKGTLNNEGLDTSTRLQIYDFFYRLDSCNAELAIEECEGGGPVDGAVKSNMASFAVFATVAIFVTIL